MEIKNGKVGTDDGGGIYIATGTVNMNNCTIDNNQARLGGATFVGAAASLTMTNTTVSTNSATGNGGGIASAGICVLNNCTVMANNATISGGGISASGGTVNVSFSSIQSNTAAAQGGGLDISGSAVFTMTNSKVSNNTAATSGGGAVLQSAMGNISNSLFSANTATAGSGGGVTISGTGTSLLTNCTFAGNTASAGGGVMMSGIGVGMVTNCTIAYNNAGGSGSGIAQDNGNLLVKNTIAANNVAGMDVYRAGGSMQDNGYNIVELTNAGFTATGTMTGDQANLNLSPALVDNGGLTLTLALLPGSIAINAGNELPNGAVAIPVTDQRGMVRNMPTDIGAYEYPPTPEIQVKGNNISITCADMTPSAADHTDFGSAGVSGGTVNRDFTIYNAGEAVLNFSGDPVVTITGANAADFTVTAGPATGSSVASNGSTIFTVRFDPSELDLRTATVSITNNDENENPFTFSIQGIGLSSNAGLSSVAGLTDATPEGGDGTGTGTPVTWSVNVPYAKVSLALGDIVAAADASIKLYTNASFTNEVTGAGTIELAAGGDTTAFIKVTAQDAATVYYYAVTINRAPPPPPTITVLAAALSADTGSSGTDFITKTAAQTISGTLSANLSTGEKVEVSFDNGASWSDAGTYTVGLSTWSTNTTLSGSNSFQARVTNASGSSTPFFTKAYVLDTTMTNTNATSAFSSDTGSSSSDFITKTAAQTVSGTLSENLAVGDLVYVSVNNGATWTAATANAGQKTWTLAGQTLASSDMLLKVRVTDIAGNNGAASSQAYVLDTTTPGVNSVSVPANGTYKAGDHLDFTVHYSENVTVDVTGGTPRIELTIGSSTVYADYFNGNGTSSLVFRYTVQPGLNDTDGITVIELSMNSGTIWDVAGNVATTTLNSVGSTAAVNVDSTAPTVTSVAVPANGTYKAGQNLNFTVNFTEAVTISTAGSTPRLSLTAGTQTVSAEYVSGTGTTSIVFRYTVQPGISDADGINVLSLALGGGTIKDAAGNDAVLTLNGVGSTANVKVDSALPDISSAQVATNYTYIDISFSEGVYGVSDGTSALTAAKLALTFTQNGGGATNCVISSVTKTDGVTPLSGGETTVRVFLNVTGTPTGAETIEIKPVNGTSVYDIAGNAMAATQTTGPKALKNPTPPPSGGSGGTGSNGTEVKVNGQSYTAGKTETGTNSSGQTVTTVTVNTDKLQAILASQGDGAVVTIPVTTGSGIAAGVLTGDMVSTMAQIGATLVIATNNATYTLPAKDIDINALAKQFGENVTLSDIIVTVSVSAPSDDMAAVVEDAANNDGLTLVVPAVEFTVSCAYSGRTVEVSSFDAYVERMIAIPAGVDPGKITTAVVIDPDGTTHHVPTKIVLIDGRYYAVINSLTNSVYAVVYNPVSFADVSNHWAKNTVNDMGARMIITGVGNNEFQPDRDITRAEFAAVIVRALGLAEGVGDSGFSDVKAGEWFCGYIKTAVSYGLITGYDDWTFRPNDVITREQAMTIIARAMAVTELETGVTDTQELLSGFPDASAVSAYAKAGIADCIKIGVVTGRDGLIAPVENISRAEAAVMIQRLLEKSGLI